MEKSEEVLKLFLEAWTVQDYQKMHELSQKTYKVGHTKNQLKSIMHQRLKSYKIVEAKEVNKVVNDFELTLRIGGKQRKSIARVICETEPFKADINGEWGVNPVSINRVI